LSLNWQENICLFLVATVQSIGGAIIFGYCVYLVWRDQFVHPIANGFTLGDVMVYFAYLAKLWEPLTRLTGVSPAIQKGAAGAKRVFDVLDQRETIIDSPDGTGLPRRPRRLVMDDVSFAYLPGQAVLQGVSLQIEPGEMVGFVGPSGAGKSTLLHLLPRFYDPHSGAIRLDGFDARQIKVADLRRHIALVPQESPILPGTIAQNIAFGSPGACREEIRQAAHLAGAAPFIEALLDGYDTEVAEGGVNLSGGQRQRLAIARALLADAPLLVLDEPTSALDAHQAQLVTQTLLSLKGERTIVLVSHRLATVALCDRIFVLDQGKVVEQGKHQELMAAGGLYYRMVQQQFSPDIPPTTFPQAA
jgi:subfamily B ATP-binding cassette protein MsbA